MLHSQENEALSATETLDTSEIELRDRLILLAKELFLKQGYSASTMEQLATTAKVSKKTVYRLFQTKENLLQRVIHSIMTHIEEVTTPLFEAWHRPFDERFEELVVQISPQYARLRSPAALREMQIVTPATYEEFDNWRRARFTFFVNMLERGRAEGVVSREFDPDELLAIYAALHNSCMDYSILEGSEIPSLDVYRAFVDIFLYGILSREDEA